MNSIIIYYFTTVKMVARGDGCQTLIDDDSCTFGVAARYFIALVILVVVVALLIVMFNTCDGVFDASQKDLDLCLTYLLTMIISAIVITSAIAVYSFVRCRRAHVDVV